MRKLHYIPNSKEEPKTACGLDIERVPITNSIKATSCKNCLRCIRSVIARKRKMKRNRRWGNGSYGS